MRPNCSENQEFKTDRQLFRQIKENLPVILGFAIIGVGVYLFWVILSRFVWFLEKANPSVAAGTIGAMATLLIGFWSNLYVQRQIKLREIDEAHRVRKIEIYQRFMKTMLSQMTANNPNIDIEQISEQELANYLAQFQNDLVLWGSPRVIKSFLSFKAISSSGGNALKGVDEVYLAIREDIGLNNQGLNSSELIKIYLKDSEELDDL